MISELALGAIALVNFSWLSKLLYDKWVKFNKQVQEQAEDLKQTNDLVKRLLKLQQPPIGDRLETISEGMWARITDKAKWALIEHDKRCKALGIETQNLNAEGKAIWSECLKEADKLFA